MAHDGLLMQHMPLTWQVIGKFPRSGKLLIEEENAIDIDVRDMSNINTQRFPGSSMRTVTNQVYTFLIFILLRSGSRNCG